MPKEIDYKRTKEAGRDILSQYQDIRLATGQKVVDLSLIEMTDTVKERMTPRRELAINLLNDMHYTLGLLDESHHNLILYKYIEKRTFLEAQKLFGNKSEPTYYKYLNDAIVEFTKMFEGGRYVVYVE